MKHNTKIDLDRGSLDQILRSQVLPKSDITFSIASAQVDSITRKCESQGFGYLYKGILPIGALGQVDDTIGISEAGHKAISMHTFINQKTAEKGLWFGSSKCKNILVGKRTYDYQNIALNVDAWNSEYIEDQQTGEPYLSDTYSGQVDMGETNEHKYLGFMISNRGDNMSNIEYTRKISIGKSKSILNKLKSLNLMKYHFEAGIIFLLSILRPSILYGCESYYNLTESEIRILENIEEDYIIKLFGSMRNCPRSQIYKGPESSLWDFK